jgi:hypothetical protein
VLVIGFGRAGSSGTPATGRAHPFAGAPVLRGTPAEIHLYVTPVLVTKLPRLLDSLPLLVRALARARVCGFVQITHVARGGTPTEIYLCHTCSSHACSTRVLCARVCGFVQKPTVWVCSNNARCARARGTAARGCTAPPRRGRAPPRPRAPCCRPVRFY